MILVSSSEARSSGTLSALFVVTWASHARMFAEAWDTYQGIPPRFFQVFEACVEKRWKLNTPCQNRLFSSKHAHQNKTSAWKLARLILTTVLHMCLYDLWPLRLGLLQYGIKIFFVHIHDILLHHIHQRNQAVSSKKASSGTGGDSGWPTACQGGRHGATDTINRVKRSHDHVLEAPATKPWDRRRNPSLHRDWT